jgi:hypothetical protein
MKSLIAAGFVVLAAVLAPSAAGQVPTQDSVTGSGVSPEAFCNGAIEIDAHSGPIGENPSGHVTCGTLFDGPVTCLNVQGNTALLTVIDDVFGTVSVRITDAGPTGDRIDAFPTPGGCPGPLPQYLIIQFSGDVVVVDAPPLPTSKDQCKHGGWRNFPGFKNQGACVSFVATGGKDPPSGH